MWRPDYWSAVGYDLEWLREMAERRIVRSGRVLNTLLLRKVNLQRVGEG